MNIFISAHEFSPKLGSECRTAWNLIDTLSKYHHLTVFAAVQNQMGTENYQNHLDEYILENRDFSQRFKVVFIDYSKFGRLIANLNRLLFRGMGPIGNPFLYFYCVKLWEKKLYKTVKAYIDEGNNPDIIHHLNHISFREPGFLWKLPYRFIWGPVSGLLKVKKTTINPNEKTIVYLNFFRNIFNSLSSLFGQRLKRAAVASRTIFTVSNEEFNFFKQYNKSVHLLLDVGIDNNNFIQPKSNHSFSDSKTIVSWAGRMDAYKSLETLIYAVSKSPLLLKSIEVHVFGSGPSEQACKNLIKELNLDMFIFYGEVPHIQLRSYLLESDILVHTSIKEASGSIISEAIELNLPFICHNAFGLTQFLAKGMGLGVELNSFNESINGFKDALECIVEEKSLLMQIQENIITNKISFSWNEMANKINESYKNSL